MKRPTKANNRTIHECDGRANGSLPETPCAPQNYLSNSEVIMSLTSRGYGRRYVNEADLMYLSGT